MKRTIIKFLILGFSVNAFAQVSATKKTFADTKDLIGVEVQFSKPLVLEPATLESVTQGVVINRLIYQKELSLGDSSCITRSYSQKMAASNAQNYDKKLKQLKLVTETKKIPLDSQWKIISTIPQQEMLTVSLRSAMGSELELNCYSKKNGAEEKAQVGLDAFQTAMTLMMNGAKLKKNGEDYRPYKNSQPSPGLPSGLTPAVMNKK